MNHKFFMSAALAILLFPGMAFAQTSASTTATAAEDYTPKSAKYPGKLVFKTETTKDGSHYRIPSLIRVDANTLLAFCDSRPDDGQDMGPQCKNTIVYKISTDNGVSWSNVKTAINSAQVDNSTYYASDVATVRDRKTGKILLISTYGNVAIGVKSSTRKTPIRVVRQYLTPSADGKTFTSETSNVDITDQIYNLFTDVTGLFFSSGAMCQSRVVNTNGTYRVYAGLMTQNKGCKVVYSDDFGQNWHALNKASDLPLPSGNECKVVELPDGNLVLSARTGSNSTHGRYFNIFTFTKGSTTEGNWATSVLSNTDSYSSSSKEYNTNAFGTGGYGNVNGSIAILPAKDKSGNRAYVLLQSLPGRKDGTNGLAIYWKPLVGIGELEEPHYWGEKLGSPDGDWWNYLATYDESSVDPTKWGVIGTSQALQRGWTKFPLYSDEESGDDSRYSTMIDNGKDGIDLLSEETRVGYNSNPQFPGMSNHILYRSFSLSTITNNEYSYYVDDTDGNGTISDDERKTYAEEYLNDNAIPLPGNTYTMRVRWKNPKTKEITEKYLYSDLSNFYDNSDEYQSPSIKTVAKKSTDAPDPHFYWTIQSDPGIATVGAGHYKQPFFYISIFNGEGYFGQRTGYNLSNGKPGAQIPGLTPLTGSEMRILELHHQAWYPDVKKDDIPKRPITTMDGYNIIETIDNAGSRRVVCFDKDHEAINFIQYSSQWASSQNNLSDNLGYDATMDSYSSNYHKAYPNFTGAFIWSTDIIFTKVRESTKSGYGTFARPEYEETTAGTTSAGYKVTFARTSEAWHTANPNKKNDDRNYYATLCLPYAVQIPTQDTDNGAVNVKVYQVKEGTQLISGTQGDQELSLEDITSQLTNRTIPRETPVLLCIENTSSDAPETKTVDFMSTDAQKPINTGFTGNFGRTLFYDQVKKQHTYTEENGRKGYIYYILAKGSQGRDKGRVALYRLGTSTNNKENQPIYTLAKNKAVFLLKSGSAAKAKSLTLRLDDDATTGIHGVKTSQSAQETKVYSIGGQYLGKDLNSLPNGVYIVNGEKVAK